MKTITYLAVLFLSFPLYSYWEIVDVYRNPHTNSPTGIYQKIECIDDINCLAWGRDPSFHGRYLRKTVNGLNEWKTVLLWENRGIVTDEHPNGIYVVEPRILDFHYFSNDYIAVMADSGRLYYTYDEFETLHLLQRNDIHGVDHIKVFKKDLVFGTVGDSCLIMDTKNNTYKRLDIHFEGKDSLDNYAASSAIHALNDTIIYVAIYYLNKKHTRILKSKDYGNTWTMLGVFDEFRITDFFFFNEQHGFMTCSEQIKSNGFNISYIFETTDGGKTWLNRYEAATNEIFYGLRQIQFADSLHGIARGNPDGFLRTIDGGKTWWLDTLMRHKYSEVDEKYWLRMFIRTIHYLKPDWLIGANESSRISKYNFNHTKVDEVHIEREQTVIPLEIYPNPSKDGEATIKITLETASEVEFRVVDYLGNTLSKHHAYMQEGENQIKWTNSENLPSGIYILTASSGIATGTKQFTILR